jgi:hypothetical protein
MALDFVKVLVKRMADDYAKKISDVVGMKRHDGPFTFRDFEKYLYCKYYVIVSLPSITGARVVHLNASQCS